MSNLRQNIKSSNQHQKIPATVVDVLGALCSVRLSSNGRVLRGVPFSGGPPLGGDTVYIDYSSGNPQALIQGSRYDPGPTRTPINRTSIVTDVSQGQLGGDGSGVVSAAYFKIIRYPGDGSAPVLYLYSAAGLTAALSDAGASTGDVVYMFGGIPIAGDFTVPTNTSLLGMSRWDTEITGTLTLNNAVRLQNLTISDETADATDAIAVIAPATGRSIIENCILLAECTSTGDAAALYFPNPSTAEVASSDSYFFANSVGGTFAQSARSEIGNLSNSFIAFYCIFTNYTDITTAVDANYDITSLRVHSRLYACAWQNDAVPPTNVTYQGGDRRQMYEVSEISSNTSIDDTDAFVVCDTSGGAFTVTLPGVGDISRKITITNTGNNILTVDAAGAQTINGSASLEIVAAGDTAQLMSIPDGTDWRIV